MSSYVTGKLHKFGSLSFSQVPRAFLGGKSFLLKDSMASRVTFKIRVLFLHCPRDSVPRNAVLFPD